MTNRPMPTPKDFLAAKNTTNNTGAAGRPNRNSSGAHLPRAEHARMLPQAARDGPEAPGAGAEHAPQDTQDAVDGPGTA